MEMSGKLHSPAAVPRGKNLGTHWLRNWMGSKAGQDLEEKSLAPARIQTVDVPVRSLYKLSGQ